MKKKIVKGLTTAFVLGATSTVFAASNPFSDVPAGHWAYQSVSKLAAQGVVEGYGDGTYRGDRNITRYEMAQMVAKAMAKNPSGANKAELDRLAAEFRDELDALGVRVAELEKYADRVVWRGKIEYTYHSYRTQTENGDSGRRKHRDNDDTFVFRLEPTAYVNDNWFLWARIDAKDNMKYDTHAQKDFYLVRGWAQGNYGDFKIRIGKPDLYTNEDGLVWDTDYSGADIQFGKRLQTRIFAGRFNADTTGGGTRGYYYQNGNRAQGEDPGNFVGINLQYVPETNKGLYGGAAYYRIKDDDFKTAGKLYSDKSGGEDVASVWSVNAGYWFGHKFRVYGAYANNTKADVEDYSWQAQVRYGNYADRAKRNDWAVFAGYKRQGTNTSFSAINWDDVILGTKGWNVGAAYAPMDNVGVILKYFKGKYITGSGDAEKLFARVELFY